MLIGYDQITAINWTLAGGSGAAWLSPDGDAGLVDGEPARAARLQWRDDGSPATGHYVELQGAFDAAATPRILCLLGLRNVPAGVKIEIRGKRAGDAGYDYALGGNAITASVRRLWGGSYGAWAVFDDGIEQLVGLAIRIYNDAGGATWATAATWIDIGEAGVFVGIEIAIEPEWALRPIDPSVRQRTAAGQVDRLSKPAYRRFEARLTPDEKAKVRGGGLAGGVDWTAVEESLLGGAPCAVIPRWKTTAGAVDADELHRTALFGIGVDLEGAAHLRGDWYGGGMTVEEVPAG